MEKKVPRRQSKTDRINSLIDIYNRHISQGMTADEAIEKFTLEQYDLLIDNDIDLNKLSGQGQKAIQDIKKAPRPKFENGYNKKYPNDKIELFNNLVDFIETIAENIELPAKVNYRDINFVVNDVKYKIVLSQPRK